MTSRHARIAFAAVLGAASAASGISASATPLCFRPAAATQQTPALLFQAPALADSSALAPSGPGIVSTPRVPGGAAEEPRTEARARRLAPDSLRSAGTGLNSPSFVMLRSLLVPGWGQLKNGAWLKAILVAGIESALVERVLFEQRMSDRWSEQAALFPEGSSGRAECEALAARHASHRRDFTWWTAFFVALSVGDAYVDAHLKRFDVRVQGGPGEEGEEQAASAAARDFSVQVGVRLVP